MQEEQKDNIYQNKTIFIKDSNINLKIKKEYELKKIFKMRII